MATATYVTLVPVTYIDQGHVREVTKAGVQIQLDEVQAAALAGSVSYVSLSTSLVDLPVATILDYDDSTQFPATGSSRRLYLSEAAGTLSRWTGTAYSAVGNGYTPGGTDVAIADGGTGASTAAGARTNLSLMSAAEVTAAIAAADATVAVTPEQYGAVGDGSTNDDAALNTCFAAAEGKTVWLDPLKTYAHNTPLVISENGTTVTGGGTLKATNSASQQSVVVIRGNNVTIDHITLTCPGTLTRRFTLEDAKLAIDRVDGTILRNVNIDGAVNFGVIVFGATNYHIESCTAKNTMADGFHNNYGATNGRIVNCDAVNTGDDCFSVVSYSSDPSVCSNIVIHGCTATNGLARGISVVGGTNIRYFDIKIDNTTAAAIYVACELPTNPSYGVSNVVISNVDVANANSGAPGVITGAVLVFNDRNTPYSVDTVSITNIRLRNTDVDAARQISLQNYGTGSITNLELGPMTFTGTVPAAILNVEGTVGYVNNINLPTFPSKTTPVDADVFAGADSAASNTPAKFTWANIKAGIATYIATLTATWTNKTLTDPKINVIYDPVNSGAVVQFVGTASAVNYLQFINSATGGVPALTMQGSDTNISWLVSPKGNGIFQLYGNTGQTVMGLGARGSATDINLDLTSKGTGVVTANAVPVVTTTGTQTLTNKRTTLRIGTVASSATPTINTDNVDQFNVTAAAVAITSMTTNLSGTPTDGQLLDVRIKGTATRAITWGASFTGTLLSTTSGTNTHLQRLKWDAAAAKWAGYLADATGY